MRVTRSLLGDVALALTLTAVVVVGTATSDAWDGVGERPIDALGLALAAGSGIVLAARRRWPRVVVAVTAVLLATYLMLGYPYGPVFFPFFVAVYTLARHRPVRVAAPVSAGALAILLVHLFTNSAALPGILGAIPASGWVVVPFALGTAVRLTREAAERERAETLRRRLDDERLHVVQEVHDIVGHGLAAIKMQSDIALHVLAGRPEQAAEALRTISRTSSEALDELRATLAVQRRDDAFGARSPVAGLAGLDELVRRMEQAGIRVELEITGTPAELGAVADIAGYRIVQEALTNVLKHSSDRKAGVRVAYEAGSVSIVVSNPIPDGWTAGEGMGISGMRRRVESLGGTFVAGPAGDRFEVYAEIPAGGAR